MLINRRKFIQKNFSLLVSGLTFSSTLLFPSTCYAKWIKENFNLGTYDETITRLFPEIELIESKNIFFSRLPKTAENGAAVPIKVSTKLDNVEKISILVKNNPHPLSTEFYLSPVMVPQVSARLKMAKSSDVIVIVEAEGQYYFKSQWVKVTKGGCG